MPAAKRPILCIPLLLTVLLAACDSARPTQYVGETMGTTWSVQVADRSGRCQHNHLQQRIEAVLETIDGQMSTYRPDSDVSRFNRTSSTDWFDVSSATARNVVQALAVSALSDGALDITVGPLVELWGFGAAAPQDFPPPAAEITAALQRAGYAHLEARLEPPALRKQRSELAIDLSAIAKGYAVEEVAALIDATGCRDYLVEVGGELAARGRNARGAAWRIAIERPQLAGREIQRTLPLVDTAIATSGDYRNFFEHAGRRYSHTIDPRTGRPVVHDLASVSVIDTSAMNADALATALMVLGPERGYALARQQDIAALFITRTADGTFIEQSTPQLDRYLERHRD